jgi:protein TonB
VKRLLFAFIIAVGLHGFLLRMNVNWLKGIFPVTPEPYTMTVTLTLRQLKSPPAESVLKKPEVLPEKPAALKKIQKTIEYQPISKPQPEFEKPPEPIKTPAPAADIPYPSTESEPIEPRPSSKVIDKNFGVAPPLGVVREARPLYRTNPSPEYPPIARKRGYQGNVVLSVLVRRDGTVGDLKVLSSSGHPVLDRAAVAAVKHWLFEPGMRGEEKVEMRVKIPIRFELK